MKINHLLKLSIRTFIARPQRTIFTILGVAIGVGAILLLVSLGYGLQKLMLEQITTEESLLTLDVFPPKAELVVLDTKVLDKIVKIPKIEEISPLAIIPGQITLGTLTSDIMISASNLSYFKLGGMKTLQGDFFKNEKDHQIVISSSLLRIFNIDPKKAINQKVNLTLFMPKQTEEAEALLDSLPREMSTISQGKHPTGQGEIEILQRQTPYTISGIIEEETTPLAYLPLQTLEDLNLKVFSEVKVKVSEPKYMEQVREEIIKMGFLVSSLSETVEDANKIFQVLRIILAAFGFVALFVAAIGLANTMFVSLLEKTNEIGAMKSLGGEDKDIKRMFLLESTLIGFLGGLAGIILGKFAIIILNKVLNILAKNLGGQAVNIFYTPVWFMLLIILFGILVGFASGLFPAKKASKMNPLEALRYK